LIARKDINLTAPVGSFESLHAAIKGGADSVYFGINKLNMRARSSANFNEDDLKKIIGICNKAGIEAYLTLNIVVYDDEIGHMQDIVGIAKEYGIRAIIASDQAVINYARSVDLEVHISTQVNISNYESIRHYAQYADAVVLARELNLDQVEHIYQRIIRDNLNGPSGSLMKLEMFVHGALCMSISGKCYLSLHEHNHSANRGECLQDCRRAYTVKEKETDFELEIDNEYIMSPKDLCTIHFLNKILDAGVRILKIEGRARPPEYVFTVVSFYDEAINAMAEGTYTSDKIANWRKRLSTVFNRGFWDGYYLGQRLGEWSEVYGSNAKKRKIYIAKGMNFFSKIKVAEFLCEAGSLHVGDDIIIMGPTTGIIKSKVHEIRVNYKEVNEAVQGDRFSIPMNQIIRPSDKLYKWIDVDDMNAAQNQK
jgi:putative protease